MSPAKIVKIILVDGISCHEATRMVLKCNFHKSSLKPQGQQLSYWYLASSWGSFYTKQCSSYENMTLKMIFLLLFFQASQPL